MSNTAFYLLIVFIGGIAAVLQAQFMGQMDAKIGSAESVFITYGGGGLLIGLVMLFMRGGNLANWNAVPSYALLAGLTGLVIVGAIGFAVPKLGIVSVTAVMLATQFIIGGLFDHFGILGTPIRPLDASRLLGVGVLLLGSWLIIR